MSLFLALLAAAWSPPQDLLCRASLQEGQGGPIGFVTLRVDPDYRPLDMRMALFQLDRFHADLSFDPLVRTLPARLTGLRFLLRYTSTPRFPLTVVTYVDGSPRWNQRIDVPFWPTVVVEQPDDADRKAGRFPGTEVDIPIGGGAGEMLGSGDIRSVAIDARGRQVAEIRFTLPGTVPSPNLAAALAGIEKMFHDRSCRPPPPPIH